MLRLEYHRLRLNRQKKEKGKGRRRERFRDSQRERRRKKKKARKKGEETKESGKRRGSTRSRNFGANREGEDPPWKRRGTVDKPSLDFGSRSRAPATTHRELNKERERAGEKI